MEVRLVAVLAVLLAALVVGTPRAQTLHIHAAVTADAPGDTTGMERLPIAGDPQRTVLVGESLLDLEPASLQTVGLEEDGNGQATLSLWLSEDTGRAFADLTERSVGKALAVVYDGRVLAAPVVRSRIANGHVRITGLVATEGEQIAVRLREGMGAGTAPPPEESAPVPAATDREVTPAPREAPSRRRFPRQPTRSGTEPLDLPPSEPVPIPPLGEPIPRSPVSEGAPPAASAPARDAEAAALAFVRAVARRDWRATADALHPTALATLRANALSMLRLDGALVRVDDGRQSGTLDAAAALGRPPGADLDALSDRDLGVLYLAGLDVLGVWGAPGPPRTVGGVVREGTDVAHVLLRPETTGRDGVSDVSVVTVRRDASGAWRPLLTQAQGF